MDFHIGVGLLSGLLTSVGCSHEILPWSIGGLQTTWCHFTCWPHGGGCLLGEFPTLEECLEFRRRALIHR
jgi:hypothetical protein